VEKGDSNIEKGCELTILEDSQSNPSKSDERDINNRWGKKQDRSAFELFLSNIQQEGYTVKSYFRNVGLYCI
jgi:hypothetical protein